MKLNTFLLLPLSLCLLPARFAEAAPSQPLKIAGIPTTVHGGLVDMEAGGNFLPEDSISPILAAMKAYPRAARFQLTWQMHGLNNATNVRFSYDRRRHTLTVYSEGSDTPSDGLGVVFSSVRPSILAAILKAHPTGFHWGEERDSERIGEAHNNNADLWGGFQFLYQRRYGCRAMNLKHGAASIDWPDTDWPNSLR